jgi:hypothetical protein
MCLRLSIVRLLSKLFNGLPLSFFMRLNSTYSITDCFLRLKKKKTIDYYDLINQTVFDSKELKINFGSFIIQIKQDRWIKVEHLKNHSISLSSYFEGTILYPIIRIFWGYRILNFKYRKRQFAI